MAKGQIVFENVDTLREICGEGNTRLKQMGQAASVAFHLRGNTLTVEGEDERCTLAIKAMNELIKICDDGGMLTSGDMVRSMTLLASHPDSKLKDIFQDHVFVPKVGKPIAPKSVAQKLYVDAVRKHDIVFAVGPAGTGKTYLAMAMAVRALLEKKVKKIILTRPAVEAGEKLGFLPGTLEEKVDPYLRPLFDAVTEMLDFDRTRKLLDKGIIEVAPLAFMRGRTLNESFVILDEAQNTTREQMKMLLTRLGFGSKAVINGDASQSDLHGHGASGLEDACNILKGVEGISICRFSDVDVVRHPLVQRVIRAYDAAAKSNRSN